MSVLLVSFDNDRRGGGGSPDWGVVDGDLVMLSSPVFGNVGIVGVLDSTESRRVPGGKGEATDSCYCCFLVDVLLVLVVVVMRHKAQADTGALSILQRSCQPHLHQKKWWSMSIPADTRAPPR